MFCLISHMAKTPAWSVEGQYTVLHPILNLRLPLVCPVCVPQAIISPMNSESVWTGENWSKRAKKEISLRLLQFNMSIIYCYISKCCYGCRKNLPLFDHVLLKRFCILQYKLDGVGPVNNRPSASQLPPPAKKCHTRHVTCYTLRQVNILSKYQLPSSYGLGLKMS